MIIFHKIVQILFEKCEKSLKRFKEQLPPFVLLLNNYFKKHFNEIVNNYLKIYIDWRTNKIKFIKITNDE